MVRLQSPAFNRPKRGESNLKKEYQRQLLLNYLRANGPMSRTLLAQTAEIRMATVTELTRELCDKQMILDAGAVDSPRGRKRRLLRLNPGYGYAVGIEFDADHVASTLVDLTGAARVRHVMQTQLPEHRDGIIAELTKAIEQLVMEDGLPLDRILGIGVADPGVVDRERGVSLMSSTIPDWQDVPLASILSSRFGVPVYMEENTRAKTYAEKRFGVARDAKQVMFIDWGPGIGCGLYLENRIHRGASGSAGEIGHIQVVPNGPICRCGSYGCLETVASMPALARRAREAIQQGAVSRIGVLAEHDLARVTAQHVFDAAREEDKLALSLIAETCTYLGIAIATAVNLLNPEMVVFEARFAEVQDLMLDSIRNTVKRHALRVATKDLEFAVSELGLEGGALGAAAVVLDTVFQIPQLDVPVFVSTIS